MAIDWEREDCGTAARLDQVLAVELTSPAARGDPRGELLSRCQAGRSQRI